VTKYPGGNRGETSQRPGEIRALSPPGEANGPMTARGNKGEMFLCEIRSGEIGAKFGQKSGEIGAKFALL